MTITKKIGRTFGWKWEQTKYKTACVYETTLIMVREKLKPLAEISAQDIVDSAEWQANHDAYMDYLTEEAYNGTI
jgi:hypothetical protein